MCYNEPPSTYRSCDLCDNFRHKDDMVVITDDRLLCTQCASKQLQQAEASRNVLATEVRAWRDGYTSHELRAVQAERDRAVLAAEIEALRQVFNDHDNWSIPFSTIQRIHKIQDATDASGALQRAKAD
jgi:hypothetical protein